jgi:hypothetical protein
VRVLAGQYGTQRELRAGRESSAVLWYTAASDQSCCERGVRRIVGSVHAVVASGRLICDGGRVNKMVVLTDDEDNRCRLVSVRLLGAAGVEVPRPAEEPRPQLGYRQQREKQRAARRRGSMIRASSMPRLRVRSNN